MKKKDIIDTVLKILNLGCGETYCESLNPFNNKQVTCGEKSFICHVCENRINMIKSKLKKEFKNLK